MVKLVAVQSVAQLLGLIERSSILAPGQFDQARKVCQGLVDARTAARRLVKEGLLSKWQAQQLLGGYCTLRLGKYRLVDELDAGPIGRVYVGEHVKLARRVALKVLPKRASDRPDLTERLLSSARQFSALDHRNIIHVYDVDLELDRYFLVLEHAAGLNLNQLLAESGRLTFPAVADMARQVASGLDYAHQRGLLHLDLRPANVLVDTQGQVKIQDFGITRLVEAAGPELGTEAKRSADDRFFRAPELSDSESTLDDRVDTRVKPSVDQRTDLFALGRLMYFTLAGRIPPADEVIPDVSELRADIPELLLVVVRKLTAGSPLDRFATAGLVEKQLEQWLSHQIVVVSRPPSPLGGTPPSSGDLPVPDEPPSGEKSANDGIDPFSSASMAAIRSVDLSSNDLGLNAIRQTPSQSATESSEFEIQFHPQRRPKTGISSIKKQSSARITRVAGLRSMPAWIAGGLVVVLAVAGIAYAKFWRNGDSGAGRDPGEQSLPATTARITTADAPILDPSASVPSVAVQKSNPIALAAPAGAPSAQPVNTDGTPPDQVSKSVPADVKVVAKGEPSLPPEVAGPANPALGSLPAVAAAAPAAPAATDATAPAPTVPATSTPPPPASDPFAGFPRYATLPPTLISGKPNPDALAAVSLGKLQIDPKAFCIIHLHGGTVASSKPKQRFVLSELNDREWQVILREGASESGGVELARVKLEKQELIFQWMESGIRELASPYLANCVLTIAAGPKSQDLPLREPTVGVPITISDFAKGFKNQWEITNPPRPEQLKIDFRLEGGQPPHKFEPGAELGFDKPLAFLKFLDKQNEAILTVKLDFAFRKSLQVNGSSFLKLAADNDWVKLTAKLINERQKVMPRMSRELENLAVQAKGLSEAKPMDEGLRNAFLRLEEGKKVAQRAIGQFAQINELITADESVRLHVRVVHFADEKQVVLFSTLP